MVNKKKLTAGVAALILCITGVTYGTLAYFTDKDTRANVITIGHVTGTLTETSSSFTGYKVVYQKKKSRII